LEAAARHFLAAATVPRQLGVPHEPQTVLGKLNVLLAHPVTMAQAVTRKMFG
jgi:hypothetical protein